MAARKRKTVLVPRAASSLTLGVSLLSMKDNGNDHLIELERMRLCERNQTKVDRFWGLEKEAFQSQVEQTMMKTEDILSKKYDEQLRINFQKELWEREFENEQALKAETQALREENERKRYMSFFYTAQ